MLAKVLVASALMAAGVGLAAPASADSDDCPLSFSFMCRMLPIAPDLDHDIDLTKEPGMIIGQPVPQLPDGSEPEGSSPIPCVTVCS